MEWKKLKLKDEDKINDQAMSLLSDPDVICTVLFAVKNNKDGSKSPIFLVSQNFRDPRFFINDFMKLLGEHAKFNQIRK